MICKTSSYREETLPGARPAAKDSARPKQCFAGTKEGCISAHPTGAPAAGDLPGATCLNAALSAPAATAPRRSGPRDGDPTDAIATALRRDGYIVLSAPLPPSVPSGLLRHFRSIDRARFKRAGIGREEDHQLNRFVRGDEIFWLDDANPSVSAYLAWMENLRLGLNRRLLLGLFDYECHYAYYDRGAFYKKHLDAFRGNTNRVLSTILYLTPNWQPRDGGELAIYPPQREAAGDEVAGDAKDAPAPEPFLKVAPRFGQMVIFLSEEFPHEVLPVNRPRYSVTGWFRVNSSLGPSIDPPL